MKKLLLSVFAMCSLSAVAQTVELITLPKTAEETTSLGWEGAWGDVAWGGFAPAGYVFSDTLKGAEVQLTLETAAYTIYEVKQGGKGIYDTYIYFGSNVGRNGSEGVFDVAAIERAGCGIFSLVPKVNGKVTLVYNRGANNSAAYVWDMTANDGEGVCVLSNITQVGDESTKKVHTPSFFAQKDHKYYIFSSDNGVELYNILWDSYASETYTQIPDSKYFTISLPKTAEETTSLGWEGAWGDVAWGGFAPAGYVFSDTLKGAQAQVTLETAAYSIYEVKQGGKGIFDTYIYFGSNVGRNGSEGVFDVAAIERSGCGIFSIVPKVNGKVTLLYNRGANNSAAYVWDMTANDGEGVCVLSNITQVGDESTKKVHTPSFFVQKDHKYYIFSSDNGVELYNIAFIPYSEDAYFQLTTPDAIELPEAPKAVKALDVNAPIYNLAGQRVTANFKGIVLQNGQKYILR